MDRDVPLVVPEVNAQALGSMPRGIVAIPNCTTTPLVMALKPLRDAVGLKRVVVTTFQSVSGTGAAAMEELVTQTKDLMAFRDVKTEVYPYQIAFNLLPHIGSFSEEGDCSEEVKIANETRKILDAPTLRVTATTVRVPVLRCHSEAINVELEKPLTANEARAAFAAMPGVIVYDDPSRKLYPMPLDATGKDEVYIGRIREDLSVTNGLNLWVVSDNLRKGAALNAVQIAECLVTLLGVLFLLVDRVPTLSHLVGWLGRLPGDISIKRDNFSLYFPLATSIVLSVILSLLFYVLAWIFRR
jgi:aspartate-semialdehyde dehydrogenase